MSYLAGDEDQKRDLDDSLSAAVELEDICIKRSGKLIVHGVTLAIEGGSWFGLVGANGSGKTTLLRAIAGRLPITSGRCSIGGEVLSDDREARAKRIGFAPPIEHLPAQLRTHELLAFAGDSIDEQGARNAVLWEALGIDELLDLRMDKCSSGMKQRISLALAFAYEAAFIILDEPFNWLDPVAALDLRTVLSDLADERVTLVTALHDMTTLSGFCDSGALMSEGQLRLTLNDAQLEKGRNDPLQFEHWMIDQLR